jgi:hypothetical protein
MTAAVRFLRGGASPFQAHTLLTVAVISAHEATDPPAGALLPGYRNGLHRHTRIELPAHAEERVLDGRMFMRPFA